MNIWGGLILLIIGIMLGGLGGLMIGFVLGSDYKFERNEAPAPDIFEEDGTWKPTWTQKN